jgi:hypothetical protein
MRLRLRWRLRTLLVAVAVAAVVLWAASVRAGRLRLAEHHSRLSRQLKARAAHRGGPGPAKRARRRAARQAAQHAELARKYERAAARPWLPFAPGPPPP